MEVKTQQSDLSVTSLKLSLVDFEGPLDLLLHLISKNKIDIQNIPIAEITDQYSRYLDDLASLDMELASEYLLMAASLMQIKSRLLLPNYAANQGEGEEDPRDELVFQLLRYQRCKYTAQILSKNYQHYSYAGFRQPLTQSDLSIEKKKIQIEKLVNVSAFFKALEALNFRNAAKYTDLSEKLHYILKRERVSLKSKIQEICKALYKKGRVFFSSFFQKSSSKLQRITSFLAVLELVKQNKVEVFQGELFKEIEISAKEDIGDYSLDSYLPEPSVFDKEYS